MNLALYCTVSEAARIAGISEPYVRLMLARGQLRGEKLGHAWLVLREDAARFVRIGRSKAATKPATVRPKARRKAAKGRKPRRK